MQLDSFSHRHIGPSENEVNEMLKAIGAANIDSLIDETVPAQIRLKNPLNLAPALTEFEYLRNLKTIASKNKVFKSYIGLGYNDTITPSVIRRNIFENPGWYTAYTPYQAEIAQGRLEAILNFQTMVMDLTSMPIANASLLDEGTAAAEAMIMFHNNRSRAAIKSGAEKFFVSNDCFQQTIDVLITRATPLNIEVVVGDVNTFVFDQTYFGALLQYPSVNGTVNNYQSFTNAAHSVEAAVLVAADLMSLAMLTPPGEWGADCVVGNSQRFGVPMGYGGPHAAFFACKEDFKRLIPGRIIGVSVDSNGNKALRMALQTREQHIRRDKATSNICTAQALLAIMASMYAVYHGPKGIKAIASSIHKKAVLFAQHLNNLGYSTSSNFFDTIEISNLEINQINNLKVKAEEHQINLRYSEGSIHVSINETVHADDLTTLINVFAICASRPTVQITNEDIAKATVALDASLLRSSEYLTHPVFNSHHSESEMMRYIKRLENKDLSLVHSMISLGSCTMKLNAATELYPVSWPEFAGIHPFAPSNQVEGYKQIIDELELDLCEITGFAGMSFQPNSGAQGEYAGLLVIRAYHLSRGDVQRNVALIPSSAHGTNPASAAMAGMTIVVIKCDENGNVDVADLKSKAEQYKDTLSCLMVTYPSTHGVYEESIIEITNIIHEYGGQVYMDGANMNAQVGLTSPGNIGADVCHLNLHKTFAIPHGGGGPGMGPIGVAAHLKPFLPGHKLVKTGGDMATTAVSAAPYGSASILLISYGYIKMLGSKGLTDATKVAILNANYIMERLKDSYKTLYVGKNGRCAHEMILACAEFKRNAHVEVADIAKRLMDYGFHAPTVAFPVVDTLMIEPTESESKSELDRFCDAMIQIRKEIDEIANGVANETDNVLKNAPHTAHSVISSNWAHSYSREKAAYPLDWISQNKFWPTVGRVDNAYGDRNLICSCPPIESYAEELV
jgi:glycine dehydrogenase